MREVDDRPIRCHQCGNNMAFRHSPSRTEVWGRVFNNGTRIEREVDVAGRPEHYCNECDTHVTTAEADEWRVAKWKEVFGDQPIRSA